MSSNKPIHSGKLHDQTITLAHGSGGKAMRDLIDDIFVDGFDSPELNLLEDQARFDMAALNAQGDRLAMTTDSYVVDPLFFPGGDIGKLAVSGTVNDLAVGIYRFAAVKVPSCVHGEGHQRGPHALPLYFFQGRPANKVGLAHAYKSTQTGAQGIVPRGNVGAPV